LANVGLFAWISTQSVQQPPANRPVPVPPGVAPLILLAERQSQKSAPESLTGELSSAESIPDQSGAESTELLIAEEIESDAIEEGPPPPPERICQTIGPLIKTDDVSQIEQRLEAEGFKAQQRSGKVREPSGYWVYLPAMPAADARRIVSELDSKGMTDYFIGKQNYISLGIFRRKKQAQVRLEQVTALGYGPILDQRYRTRTVHWLDIEAAGQPLLASSIWQQIQAQHADIRLQRVSCE
jgi:hypothetical protein